MPAITFAAVAALALLLRTLDTAAFTVFLARDLARAQDWISGHPVWFGPEMTAGGVLPGPFFYWLLAPAALLRDTWQAVPLTWIILFAPVMVMVWRFVSEKFGAATGILALGLLGVSKQVRFILNEDTNTSAAAAFQLAAILGIVRVFEKQDRRTWLFTCLALGLALQLHMNTLSIVAAIALLQILGKRIGLRRLTRREIGEGVAAFLVPLAPFGIWWALRAIGVLQLPSELAAAGNMELAPLRILSPILAGSWGKYHSSGGQWLGSILDYQFGADPLLIACAGLALAGVVFYRESTERGRSLRALAGLTLMLGLLTVPLVLSQDRYRVRYVCAFELALPVLLAAAAGGALNRISKRVAIPLAGGLLLLICALTYGGLSLDRRWVLALPFLAWGAWITFSQSPKICIPAATALLMVLPTILIRPPRDEVMPRQQEVFLTAHELGRVLKRVRESTGWVPERALSRIYQVGLDAYMDYSVVYRSVASLPASTEHSAPDGYFLIASRIFPSGEVTAPHVSALKELPEEVRKGISSGTFELGATERFDSSVLVPYRLHREGLYPLLLHNLGAPYILRPEYRLLKAMPPGEQLIRNEDGSFLYYRNPEPGSWTRPTGVIFGGRDRVRGGLSVFAKIFGYPLSQPVREVAPGGVEYWESPFLELSCEEAGVIRREKVVLASRVGLKPVQGRPHAPTDQALLAPFESDVVLPCRGRPRELAFGIEGGSSYSNGVSQALGPVRVSLSF